VRQQFPNVCCILFANVLQVLCILFVLIASFMHIGGIFLCSLFANFWRLVVAVLHVFGYTCLTTFARLLMCCIFVASLLHVFCVLFTYVLHTFCILFAHVWLTYFCFFCFQIVFVCNEHYKPTAYCLLPLCLVSDNRARWS